MGQDVLGKTIEKVALVFGGVGGFRELVYGVSCAVLARAHTGVMPGCHRVAAHAASAFQQQAKFDAPVAERAGVGCHAALIRLHKRLHHIAVKGLAAVKHGEGNTQLGGNGAGILNVARVAAPRLCAGGGGGGGVIAKEAHGAAYAVIALFYKETSGHALSQRRRSSPPKCARVPWNASGYSLAKRSVER